MDVNMWRGYERACHLQIKLWNNLENVNTFASVTSNCRSKNNIIARYFSVNFTIPIPYHPYIYIYIKKNICANTFLKKIYINNYLHSDLCRKKFESSSESVDDLCLYDGSHAVDEAHLVMQGAGTLFFGFTFTYVSMLLVQMNFQLQEQRRTFWEMIVLQPVNPVGRLLQKWMNVPPPARPSQTLQCKIQKV